MEQHTNEEQHREDRAKDELCEERDRKAAEPEYKPVDCDVIGRKHPSEQRKDQQKRDVNLNRYSYDFTYLK